MGLMLKTKSELENATKLNLQHIAEI